MPIEKAIDILVKDSGTHFDKKMTDTFLSVETDKIVDVVILNNKEMDENDRAILAKYKLYDLYTFLIEYDTRVRTTEEDRFISTFLKYYNDEAA